MVTIKETDATRGFAVPVFFERTEKLREKIVECTREELIDLAFAYLGKLESIQGSLQKHNNCLEEFLGYLEPLTETRG